MKAEHFDVIVVGSGFGGSVSAFRLAEAGLRVCVLERGKAYPPGSFPRSPHTLKRNFWNPSEGSQGMFDFWSFRHCDALVASGLGGGSLIYANVMLRKDEKWFVNENQTDGSYEDWPVTRADLDRHYDRVEEMLGATEYPFDREPYSTTAKTRAFHAAARASGHEPFLPKLAVTFAPESGAAPVTGEPIVESRPNLHGRTRLTCQLVGECDVGCNYGAKNTLDYNYLTEAQHHGADIRTLCEVRTFKPREGGGFTVHYVRHEAEHEGQTTDTSSLAVQAVTADRLFLSAGTLGTTFLLLRNRSAFPALSPTLGRGFTGNGDLLTFALNCRDKAAGGRAPRVIDPSYGPVITSAIRVADELDGDGASGRGFYLEDAGLPDFVTWILQTLDFPEAAWGFRFTLVRLLRRLVSQGSLGDISGAISAGFGDCGLSAGVLPLLGMGRDVPNGVMSLGDDGLLANDWKKGDGDDSGPFFDRLRKVAREMGDQLGGEFLDNPIWLLQRVITVHSLGGCRMGETDKEGVVNAWGEVFGVPGLYVADGSVMPGPVGANPSLTIAALADRFADGILERGRPRPVAAGSR